MPALDACHSQVVRALRKEGWSVSAKPRYIADTDDLSFFYIDIEAHRRDQHIFVEVKCFPSQLSDEIYTAVGQYLVYRVVLEKHAPGIPLYLAIPQRIYENMFKSIEQEVLRQSNIKFLLVDIEKERIVAWNE